MELYYLAREKVKEVEGPFTMEQLLGMCMGGTVTERDMYTPEGSSEWKSAQPIWEAAIREQEELDLQKENELIEKLRAEPPISLSANSVIWERQPRLSPANALIMVGVLLMGGGMALMVYYWMMFSVAAPGETTVNLGLISDRQDGLMASAGFGIIGAVLFAAGLILERIGGKE